MSAFLGRETREETVAINSVSEKRQYLDEDGAGGSVGSSQVSVQIVFRTQ